MQEVTLRFKTDDESLIDALVNSWLQDREVRVIANGKEPKTVNLTHVKERTV